MTVQMTGPNSKTIQSQDCTDETYDDEVTPEVLTAMNEVVSDDDFTGYEVVDGPAW